MPGREQQPAPALEDAAGWLVGTLGPAEAVTVADEGLDTWLAHFQALQWREIWESHGDWVTSRRPTFGPGIAERFGLASQVPDDAVEQATAFRREVAERLRTLLSGDAILVLPSAPGAAPFKGLPQDQVVDYRNRALGIHCIAGLAYLPQLSIPAAMSDTAPVGISLVGGPGSDRMLLAAARRLGPPPA